MLPASSRHWRCLNADRVRPRGTGFPSLWPSMSMVINTDSSSCIETFVGPFFRLYPHHLMIITREREAPRQNRPTELWRDSLSLNLQHVTPWLAEDETQCCVKAQHKHVQLFYIYWCVPSFLSISKHWRIVNCTYAAGRHVTVLAFSEHLICFPSLPFSPPSS